MKHKVTEFIFLTTQTKEDTNQDKSCAATSNNNYNYNNNDDNDGKRKNMSYLNIVYTTYLCWSAH